MAETIAAISTALGEGGIGIVRVSGPASLEVMRKMMRGCPQNVDPRHAYLGRALTNDGEVIDEALFIYMQGPRSYTGEDMLEIQAHGSNVSLKEILRNVISGPYPGIRLAEPGEFTKLAFLNGKMDLSQAEAVIDIIKSKTDVSLAIAESQRSGRLSMAINEIREQMLNVLANMAVNIDYPDEDIEDIQTEEILRNLREVQADVNKLIDSSSIGRIAREGIRIAIVGKPNVGKSSLMNALLGEGRVIVTDIPGTTRDTVEEAASLDGLPIVLVDTAGLRETEDTVEKIGIERTEKAISAADMVMLVIDGSEKLEESDEEILKVSKKMSGDKILVVINKTDLGTSVTENEITEMIPGCTIISTTLKGKNAIESASLITKTITDMFALGNISAADSEIINNERHVRLLHIADDNLTEAINMICLGEPYEVVELSARYAYEALGNIIGEEVGEEVIDAVFSRFCLGK